MKIIVCGSRSLVTVEKRVVFSFLDTIADSHFNITEVVSGAAKGADMLGEEWARKHNIPIIRFLPDWEQYGRSAGIRRNIEMGKYADGVIALWDYQSKGTRQMMEYAKERGMTVAVAYFRDGVYTGYSVL